MATTKTQDRLADVLCELFPADAPKIRAHASRFYANHESRFGESLVAAGDTTREKLELGLLTQKARAGRLDAADQKRLADLNRKLCEQAAKASDDFNMLVTGLSLAVRRT